MRKFLLFCLIGVLGTVGCTRDIPTEPAEEWRGSYRLISGTSGGSAIDVADPPQGTPRHIIFTAAASDYGTVVFVYNPPLAAPPMASVTYEKTVRHYWRTSRATRDQLRVEFARNHRERSRLSFGSFYIWQSGPRLPLAGEFPNDIRNNYTSPFPLNEASDALNEPNRLLRLLPGAEEDSRVRVLGNGRVRINIPNNQRPDNRSFQNRNNRTAICFQSPWPWEDPRPHRMMMFVEDGNGIRYGIYEPPADVVAELAPHDPPYSGTWSLADAHLNGTWMDAEAPFPSIPATLDIQWFPVLERSSPRHRAPSGHEHADGVLDPLIENGVIIEQGLVEITFARPLGFSTHDDEFRFFNRRAGYVIQNGVPVLNGQLRGGSQDGTSLTYVTASDVDFSKEGDILTVNLIQGGASYILQYRQAPLNPQQLEGFGVDSTVVKPVPADLFDQG